MLPMLYACVRYKMGVSKTQTSKLQTSKTQTSKL